MKKTKKKSSLGTKVGNLAAKATGWPKGINDMSLNKSGTVGTEPISKGNSKYTEIKAGKLGKVDVPMGKLKKVKKSKKHGLRPASAVVKSEQNASHQMYKKIKMTGSYKGKSNKLGQGGRAAQLKAQGVPGGVIGNLARAAQAAPGQKNYHKKKMTQKQDDAADKKAGRKEGSKADIKQDRLNGIKDKKKAKTMCKKHGKKMCKAC